MAIGLLLLAACAAQPRHPESSSQATVPPGDAGNSTPSRPASADVGNVASAKTDPAGPSGTAGKVSANSSDTTSKSVVQNGTEYISVIGSRLNGIWTLRIPREIQVGRRTVLQAGGVGNGSDVDLFCRISYVNNQYLTMSCPMYPPISQPARGELEGDQFRFEWWRGAVTVAMAGRFTAPLEIAGEELIGTPAHAPRPVASVHMAKFDRPAASSPQSDKAEKALRRAIDDMRHHTTTGNQYAPLIVDRLELSPPISDDDLASFGAIDKIIYLGPIVVAGETSDENEFSGSAEADPAVEATVDVFSVEFDQASRLCRIRLSPEQVVVRLNCG